MGVGLYVIRGCDSEFPIGTLLPIPFPDEPENPGYIGVDLIGSEAFLLGVNSGSGEDGNIDCFFRDRSWKRL
jgi:hypothetical protein